MDGQWFAVAAGGIGVTFGWLLSQTTEVAKWWWGRNARIAEEYRDRGLAYLQAADDASMNAVGLGVAHGLQAEGRTLDDEQHRVRVDGFNVAFSRLERLRDEAHLFGPEWLAEAAPEVTNSLRAVQDSLRATEHSPSSDDFAVLAERLNAFQGVRKAVMATAKAEIGRPS